jgi:nucleoside-diphosphate-sugar epimerase
VLRAADHDVVAFASRARTVDGIELRPIEELPDTPHDVLLHYAYATREHAERMGVDAYVATNVTLTETVLEALRRRQPRALFYASSGAVYGAGSLAENPYAVLKRHDELTLRQAMRDLGGRSVVARVFNVAGPWMHDAKGFAMASLIAQVQAGGPVEVRARHRVRRSFADVEDLAALAVALTEDGPEDAVFDSAGDIVVEVGDLAERVARVLGRPDVEILRTLDPDAPADDYVGDGTRMRELAGQAGVPLRSLDEQIRRTAEWMADGR